MLTVKFFASFREKAGKKEMTLDIKNNTQLIDVVRSLNEVIPGLDELIEQGNGIVAVNHEIVDKNTVVKDGDEIAIFPPVSGG